MTWQELKFYNLGIINGWLTIPPRKVSLCPLIVHPLSSFSCHKTAQLEIDGRLIFGYPWINSRIKKQGHHGEICLDRDSKLTINGKVHFNPDTSVTILRGSSLTISDGTMISRGT